MKLQHLLPLVVAVASMALPITADARDRGSNQSGNNRSGNYRSNNNNSNNSRSSYRSSSSRSNRSYSRHSDRHDHGRYDRGHHRGYYGNSYYRSYPRYYGYGGYGYGGYGYGYGYPYYRPSLSFSYYGNSSPVYRGRSYASSSQDLSVEVQRELRERGYYRGAIDGSIGAGSRAAIRGYQRDRGLAVTGRIDSTLLRSLGVG